MVDDVGARLVHGLGDNLGLRRLEPAVEVGWLCDVGVQDPDVRVHGADACFEAGVEPPDEVDVDAADEADGAGRGLQRRGCADQERALVLGEDQPGEVVGAVGGAVDDAEVGVGVVGRHLGDGLAEQEAHADHQLGAVGAQLQQLGPVGAVGVRRGLGGVDTQLGGRPVQSGCGGVVERLVAAPADVEHQRRGDVLGARWGRRRLGGCVSGCLGRRVGRCRSRCLGRPVVGGRRGCRCRLGGGGFVVAAARCRHHHGGQQDRQYPGKSSSHCLSFLFAVLGSEGIRPLPMYGGSWESSRREAHPLPRGDSDRIAPRRRRQTIRRWRHALLAVPPARDTSSGGPTSGIACNRSPARRRSGRPAPAACAPRQRGHL